MAKEKIIYKIDIEKNQKAIKRNRRNKMLGKIFAALVVLIFVGSIVGVTVFTYNTVSDIWWENVGEEANVEFKELFTLFNGLTDTDESKIVTKGYAQEDLDGFYSNIKRKLYLAEDYDLSLSKIISSVMTKTESGEQNLSYSTEGVDGYDLRYVYLDAQGEEITDEEKPSEGSGENPSLTGNEQLDELLKEIKFDFSSLSEYDGASNILELTDKQIAAAINEALTSLSGSFDALKQLETTIGKPLSEVLEIKQIIIGGNEVDSKQTSFKITLSVKVKDLLSNILAQNNLPPIINSILPKQLYATAIVYPNDTSKAVQVSINRMGEERIDKIIRIADVIFKKSGQTTTISSLLVQVNTKVAEVINSAQKIVPLVFVPTGSIDLHPIETMINLLGVDVSEQAFLTMIRDIKLPTADSLGLNILGAEEKAAKTQKFISELSGKYCLDNSKGDITADNTIKNVIDLAQSDDILNKVQLANMTYTETYNPQSLKVRTEYSALAAMLSDYIAQEGLLGDIKADIVGMSYTAKNAMLSVDISVDVAAMLGFDGGDVMSGLISQLVPAQIFVTANICTSAELEIPSSVEINKVGADNSKGHLSTLTALAGKFGMDVSQLDYDGLCAKVDEGIKQGIGKIEQEIKCEIIFSEECAYLPNLFEVVCGTGLLDESEEKKIQPQNLYSIMKQVYTFELTEKEQNKSLNANGFIGELEGKYYLQDGKVTDNGDGKLLDDVMKLKDTFGTSIDKSKLAGDGRGMDSIYPLMSEGEFAYLIGYNVKVDELSDILKSASILGATSKEGELRLHIGAKLYEDAPSVSAQSDEPAPDGTNPDGQQPAKSEDLSKYSNLLPQEVFVTVIIDTQVMLSAGEQSCAKVVIDGMSGENMDDFFSIVRKLTGKAMNAEEIESKIDTQVKEYMGRIEGIDYNFVDGGLRIDNLFNVISKSEMVKPKTEQEHKFTADEIRRLLRDLYGYDWSTGGKGDFTPAESLDRFIDSELYNKYFISESFQNQLRQYDKEGTLLDGFRSFGGTEFNVNKMRITDLTSLDNVTDTDGKSDVQLKQEIEGKFKPKFTAEEFAYLLSKEINVLGNMSFMTDQKVSYVGNDEFTMNMTVTGKGNIEDENAKGLMPDDFYINLTIELGDIGADSNRSEMNVHSMDINSVEYVEDGGEEQDLHLLITFINRIKDNTKSDTSGGQEPPAQGETPQTLDGILTDVEKNLNSFKAEIHNDVFTVSFLPNGGFMFNETVYQIARNSVYDTKANAVIGSPETFSDEISFRNGLCKINNMPAAFTNDEGVVIDFANGNRAENTSYSVGQINDKYALTDGKQLKGDEEAILSILGDYAKDYATNIDGVKLTSAEKRAMTINQLRPSIIGEELILMLEKSVKFTADGYKDARMIGMYIRDNSMLIVYQSAVTMQEENAKYNDLLPSLVSLVVNIDVEKMNTPDVLCADISINDLKDDEVSAIEGLISKLNAKEGESQNLTDANKQCSDSVRKTMKELTDNVGVDFKADPTVDGVTGGGVMELDSIYEISSDKINSAGGEDKITAQDVKDTLEALHSGLDISAYQPPTGLTKEQMKVTATPNSSLQSSYNLLLTGNIVTRKANISGAIGGWNIASMIDTDDLLEPLGLKENAVGKTDVLILKHTALIPTVANGDGSFADIRNKLGALGDREYFLLTLDTDTEAAAGVKMSILPERMDLTLYMDITDQQMSVIYNAMTDAQRQILSRLVKTSRPDGTSGLDVSNTDAVRDKILDLKIINHDFGSGVIITLTLRDVLSSSGLILPIDKVKDHVTKNDNVVLGMGAIIIDMEKSASL